MKELTISEMRAVQLEMLDRLDKVCREHGLRYYLCGGTLLGAVRHKGYIPWDDDIDVNILRPDLDRLLEITGGKLGDGLVIVKPGERKDKSLIFYRIYNEKTLLVSRNQKLGTEARTNIFIDVFPVDALPSSSLANKMVYLWSGFLISLGNMSAVGRVVGTSRKKRFVKSLLLPIAKLHSTDRWNEITDRFARKRNYEKARYVGVINTEAAHRFNERILKSEYEPAVEVEFEGKRYPAPKGWDIYLRNLYGADYMELPPAEKRESHHDFQAFLLEGEERV